MRRRTFITLAGGLATWPLAARAQAPGKVWRIGMLDTASAELNAANLAAFRKGLSERGYIEGQNLVIDYRFSIEGSGAHFRDLAAQLVSLKVDLIVVRSAQATLAVRQATTTIPVVMSATAEPLGIGAADSLSHPGGNVTGFSAFTVELVPKLIDLLKDIVPGMRRVALLDNLSSPTLTARWELTQMAARALGVEPLLLGVRASEDFRPGFEAAARQRADGLITGLHALLRSNLRLIVDLSAQYGLPTIYPAREFVDAGGLVSYGANYADLYFRTASFIDRIFKGTRAADLPVEQPTALEMTINLKTAKTLGLAIPQSVLLRADHVIE